MLKDCVVIVGRAGIILLLTGIVILLVEHFRYSVHTNRLASSLVTYLWGGLTVVGLIFVLIFVIGFALNERKHTG
jgi:hypothetical protein